jgi:hypothetical protein
MGFKQELLPLEHGIPGGYLKVSSAFLGGNWGLRQQGSLLVILKYRAAKKLDKVPGSLTRER